MEWNQLWIFKNLHLISRQNHRTLLSTPFLLHINHILCFKYRLVLWNCICIHIIWQRLGETSAEFMMVHVLSSGLSWSLWKLLQKHNRNVFHFALTRWITLEWFVCCWALSGCSSAWGLICLCLCVFGRRWRMKWMCPAWRTLWRCSTRRPLTSAQERSTHWYSPFLLWYILSHNPL